MTRLGRRAAPSAGLAASAWADSAPLTAGQLLAVGEQLGASSPRALADLLPSCFCSARSESAGRPPPGDLSSAASNTSTAPGSPRAPAARLAAASGYFTQQLPGRSQRVSLVSGRRPRIRLTSGPGAPARGSRPRRPDEARCAAHTTNVWGGAPRRQHPPDSIPVTHSRMRTATACTTIPTSPKISERAAPREPAGRAVDRHHDDDAM